MSAASRELKIDGTLIGRVCRGKGRSAGGYGWRYIDYGEQY